MTGSWGGGLHMIGPEAPEIMQAAAVAVRPG